ncbi:MAG: CocE/NonD family hydrolase [Nocardioidaceae bacterium]
MRASHHRLAAIAASLLGLVAATASVPGAAGATATGPGHSGRATPASSATALQRQVQATTPSYTKRAVTIPVRIGPKNATKCTIAADLYRPTGVGRRHRAPAILTTNGFGGAKNDANQAGIGKGFAQEGYVVLSYSGLGFGGSGCRIYLDSPSYDGKAGKQLVSVLAGAKRAFWAKSGNGFRIHYVAKEHRGDPRVGMIGGSYGGQIQYAVAMQDRRVDALIPIITWNDLSYSLAPNNTSLHRGVTYATPGVHKKQWTSFFFAVGIEDGISGSSVDPQRNTGCPNFDQRACQAKAQLEAQGYPNATTRRFARHASVSSYMSRIKAPTLLVQGQNDTLFNLQEAVATYQGLRKHGTPTRMVWQSWGHSMGGTPAAGEIDLGAKSIRDSYLGRRFLHWMDHYVRGNHAAPIGPRFCYFRDWVHYNKAPQRAGRAIAKAYSCHGSYTGGHRNASLYFTGGHGLTKHAARVKEGSASYANAPGAPTSYSETSALEGVTVNNPPSDGPGTFAAFTSRRLDKPAAIVGSPVLTVHLQAPVAEAGQSADPGTHLVLFAKIYDVAPDGSIELQNRLISPVRVTDVAKPVHIALPGVVQRIKAGHRIRVVLAASDAAYAGNTVVQPVTVKTSRKHPSVLRVPLASGRLHLR